MKETKEVNNKVDNVIYAYTRQQAIDDGILIDISQLSITKEAGYKIPVVITQGVFALVSVPKELEGLQDFNGRLWDVLFMSTLAFRSCNKAHPENTTEECRITPFKTIFQMTPRKKSTVDFWLVFNAHEGFTIMKPEEY